MCPGSLASIRIRLFCQDFGTGRLEWDLRYDCRCRMQHFNSHQPQGSTLQCIETFRGLERITVHCQLDDAPSISAISASGAVSASGASTRTLRSVLASVHSAASLLSITVDVWPSDSDSDRNDRSSSSYGVDRTGLVDLLLGDEMLAILSRFPELHQLHFSLRDNDGEYNSGWWTAEMVRRFPDSGHAAVSVEMLYSDGA